MNQRLRLKLIITDFDGTLVDSFRANLKAYQVAFASQGLELKEEDYRRCFGLRFERFMQEMHIYDQEVKYKIRMQKGDSYPRFFDRLKINKVLLSFIRSFKASGGKTAIASTARKKNLMNALEYIGASEDFDLIIAGEDVKNGKPSPEIYNTVLEKMNVKADEAIVFEDSQVGFESAEAAGISYIKVDSSFYGD